MLFNFWTGLIIGATIMDFLWAWKIGLVSKFIETLKLKWKLIKAKTL
tara:strand:+ start:338 stop:478 length:141 start_codon:yes stop_codon:yes gene_type:complete